MTRQKHPDRTTNSILTPSDRLPSPQKVEGDSSAEMLRERSQSENYQVREAIRVGQQADREDSYENFIEIQLTVESKRQLKELGESLFLNNETLIESAIQHLIYYASKTSSSIEEIVQHWHWNGNEAMAKSRKYELSVPTIRMLEQVKMEDRIYECATIGIDLLYQNNCSYNNFKAAPPNS